MRRLKRRRAGRAESARGAHHSMTALGPRPSVLTLGLVADSPELRTERGSRSSGLEESGPLAIGQAGSCSEGLWIELHLLLSALLPVPGLLALGTDKSSTFPSLSKGLGSSGVFMPPPSHLPPLTPTHSLEMELDVTTTFHP